MDKLTPQEEATLQAEMDKVYPYGGHLVWGRDPKSGKPIGIAGSPYIPVMMTSTHSGETTILGRKKL